ncbi:MAG: metallophosphoesterase, partial [Myxococcales bacterium]|nr:metallophosphoesterase [Myxococcales bacterium]
MRRVLALLTFFVVALSILAGLHAYLLDRLVWRPALPEPWSGLLTALVFGLLGLVFLMPLLDRRVGPPRSRVIAWPATIWIGVFWLLLVATVASDVALLIGSLVARLVEAPAIDGLALARGRALVVVALAFAASSAALRSGLSAPLWRRVEVELDGLAPAFAGARIVQLSDVHIGPTLGRRFLARLVARVNAAQPDAVVVTGDLVDGGVRALAGDVAPLAELQARDGVFFVTGNHDHYSNADAWTRHLVGLGLRVLRNEHVHLTRGDARLCLAGVDDHRGDPGGGARGDVAAALAGRDERAPVILLAHDPATFREAARRGVDLQLSGHTHGGQLWPFNHLVRLTTPYVAGHFRRG